jgi:CBS domain-containing protein
MTDKQEQKEQRSSREGKTAEQSFAVGGRKVGETIARGSREAEQSLEESARALGETIHETAQAGGNLAQRGLRASGEGARQFAETSSRQVGQLSEQIATSTQQMMEDLEALMRLPNVAGTGLQQLQQAASGVVDKMVQANTKTAEELFRMANPAAVFAFQQRCLQQYMHGFIEASGDILRLTRQIAEDQLQPLEEYTRQAKRRQGKEGQRGAREQKGEKVADVMTPHVEIASPNQSVQEIARLMVDADTGVLPVGENDRLVGMITDRDIAVRVAAEGKDPKQVRVREVMSPEVRYCYEDEDLEHVAENMAEQQVRRLPVMNRGKRLVGIISLGDIATRERPHTAGLALRGISQAGGQRSQSAYAGARPGRGE